MAVAYVSKQTASGDTAGAALTITKPTSLAAGDLMVAFLYGGRNASDWSTLSGWTKLGAGVTTDGTDANMTVLAKVASSGDAAASDFTFTPNGSHEEKFGALLRITGNFAGGISALVVSDFDNDVVTTATGGVTPIGTSSLLLMGIITHSTGASGGNSWAVTNNNPSWTQLENGLRDTAVDMGYSLAYGNYASASATGNYSWSNGGLTSGACLISISELVNTTATPAVITSTATFIAPTVAAGATVTPAVITTTATIIAPSVATPTPDWSNQSKSSTSWTNQNQS